MGFTDKESVISAYTSKMVDCIRLTSAMDSYWNGCFYEDPCELKLQEISVKKVKSVQL